MGKVQMTGGTGGLTSDDVTALKSDVLLGKTALTSDSDDEASMGTLELTGTATTANVISGKTFYSTDAKTKLAGTIPSLAATTYTPKTSSQIIGAGQYLSGNQTIAAIDGTAQASNILAGKTASSAYGINIVGTMPDYASGRTVFNGASFDGALVKGISSRGASRLYTGAISSNGSIGSTGLSASFWYDSYDKKYMLVGATFSEAINFTPFSSIKITYDLIEPTLSENNFAIPQFNTYLSTISSRASTYNYMSVALSSYSRDEGTDKTMSINTRDLNSYFFLSFGLSDEGISGTNTKHKRAANLLVKKIEFVN